MNGPRELSAKPAFNVSAMPTRTKQFFTESAGPLRLSEGRWQATLITAGEGSSGTYSEEMLAEYAPIAFPKGTKLWFGHPKEGEGPGDRDARDQWGVLEEDATLEPGNGAVGKIRVLAHWKDVVESLGDQASLSIYSLGESDEDGNVTALLAHETNSVDMVGYPGRPGSGLKKKIEAARAASDKPGPSAQDSINKEEAHMEELTKAVEALTTLMTSYISERKVADDATRQAEADAQAKEKDVAEAVEAAVAAVEAVKAAKVLPLLEAKLIDSAKTGADVTEELAFAVKVTAEAAAPARQDESSSFTIHENAGGLKAEDFSLNLGGRH